MNEKVISFLGGSIFAIGLVISGMTNPEKVLGFLDVSGSWDYSLAFVMGGAVLFNLFSFRIILKKSKPIFSKSFYLPESSVVDFRLVLGAITFGAGWGILGICPGPGLVNLVSLNLNAFLFLFSMIAGMMLFKKLFQ